MACRNLLSKGKHSHTQLGHLQHIFTLQPSCMPTLHYSSAISKWKDDWHTSQLILVGCYNSVVQYWQPDKETKNEEYYFQMNSQECIQLERLFFDLLRASLKPLSLFQKKQFWKQMGVNEKFMPALPHSPKWAVLNDLCLVPVCN